MKSEQEEFLLPSVDKCAEFGFAQIEPCLGAEWNFLEVHGCTCCRQMKEMKERMSELESIVMKQRIHIENLHSRTDRKRVSYLDIVNIFKELVGPCKEVVAPCYKEESREMQPAFAASPDPVEQENGTSATPPIPSLQKGEKILNLLSETSFLGEKIEPDPLISLPMLEEPPFPSLEPNFDRGLDSGGLLASTASPDPAEKENDTPATPPIPSLQKGEKNVKLSSESPSWLGEEIEPDSLIPLPTLEKSPLPPDETNFNSGLDSGGIPTSRANPDPVEQENDTPAISPITALQKEENLNPIKSPSCLGEEIETDFIPLSTLAKTPRPSLETSFEKEANTSPNEARSEVEAKDPLESERPWRIFRYSPESKAMGMHAFDKDLASLYDTESLKEALGSISPEALKRPDDGRKSSAVDVPFLPPIALAKVDISDYDGTVCKKEEKCGYPESRRSCSSQCITPTKEDGDLYFGPF